MKFLISFILVVSSFSLIAQDQIVRGFISDGNNSEPIPFEKVMLIPTEKSQAILGAMTDVNGFFSIAKVPKGTYMLKIQNPIRSLF